MLSLPGWPPILIGHDLLVVLVVLGDVSRDLWSVPSNLAIVVIHPAKAFELEVSRTYFDAM